MIKANVDPRLAARQADTNDLIRFKREMDGLKDRLTTGETKDAQLKKACQNFEAVFISKLWQQMKQSVPKEGYLHSKQEDSYMAMFDKDFAEKMSEAGGIGLADMIYSQLSEKLKEVSKTTLSGGVDIKPLAAQPIGLNMSREPIPLKREEKGMTLEDWGGEAAVSTSGGKVEPPSARDIVSGLTGRNPAVGRLTDLEVQAQLDTLARKLEAEQLQNTVAEKGASLKNNG